MTVTITRSQLIHALHDQDITETTPRAAGHTDAQLADLLVLTGQECVQHHDPEGETRLAAELHRLGHPIYNYLFTTKDGLRDIPVTGASMAGARAYAEQLAGEAVVILSSNEP